MRSLKTSLKKISKKWFKPARRKGLSSLLHHSLVIGTCILTATGLASRMIGFFYRIFLSRLFGEESMGIYQLIGPVLALVFSLSSAGLQNAISKFVAGKTAVHDYKASGRFLLVGFSFSLGLSLLCMLFVRHFAAFIAGRLLFEERCEPLLVIISLSFPFSCIHSCVNGYFYGLRKTAVPAFTQLTEQLFRVGSVFFITSRMLALGKAPSIRVAAAGLVIGECSSALLALSAVLLHFCRQRKGASRQSRYSRIAAGRTDISFRPVCRQILGFAAPLSANRLCLNLLSAIEAACIPAKLQVYGHSVSQSLRVYGVLTGMALPLIYFPGALTNSVSVLLMPAISEADSLNNQRRIRCAVRRCLSCCLFMGCACCCFFLSLGKSIGQFLYGSLLAGQFILMLSFMCPFLYLNTTLLSILHGLGKTGYSFFLNLTSLLLRLLFVFYAIPVFGIRGYLAGMLLSQIYTAFCCLFCLRRYLLPE